MKQKKELANADIWFIESMQEGKKQFETFELFYLYCNFLIFGTLLIFWFLFGLMLYKFLMMG